MENSFKFKIGDEVTEKAGMLSGKVKKRWGKDPYTHSYEIENSVNGKGYTFIAREDSLYSLKPNCKKSINSDHQLHKTIIEEIHDTYKRKNADYGNSFGDQYNEYGMLSAIIRFDDKMRRLKQLHKNEAQVKDESVRDTVLDLANYAIMCVMELDKKNDITNDSK